MQGKIQVFFRFDDITALSNIVFERQLAAVFQQLKVTCSIGVVPMVTKGDFEDPAPRGSAVFSKEKIDFLRTAVQDGAFDVLLHGYSHQTKERCSKPSEFAGLSLGKQEELLRSGKSYLKKSLGIDVTCFIPPWNTYDRNTLQALKNTGFKSLSANLEGPVASGLNFVQYTVGITGLRAALKMALDKGMGGLVGVLLHPCDFVEHGGVKASFFLYDLANEIAWLQKQSDVRISSISQLAADPDVDVGSDRFQANKAGFWESINPPFVNRFRETRVYWPSRLARRDKRLRLCLVCSFYLFVLLGGLGAANGMDQILNRLGLTTSVSVLLVGLAVVVLTARGIRDRVIYFKPFLLLIFFLGCFMGLIL